MAFSLSSTARALRVPSVIIVFTALSAIHAAAAFASSQAPSSDSSRATIAIRTSPGHAEVMLDSVRYGDDAPRVSVPLFKPIVITVRMDDYMTKVDTVVLRAPTDTTFFYQLYHPSSLMITSAPDSGIVYKNDVRMGTTPLLLSNLTPDPIRIAVYKKFYDPWIALHMPVEGNTANVTAVLKRKESSLNVFVDPPAATVYVDDKPVSQGSLKDFRILEGSHKISLRDEASGRSADHIMQTYDGRQYDLFGRLGRESIERGVIGIFIPGSAQIADHSYLEGSLMLIGSAALAYNAISSQRDYVDRRSVYDRAYGEYIAAPSEVEASRRYDDVKARKSDLDRYYARRTVSFSLFAAAYAYIVADAFLHHLVTDDLDVAASPTLLMGAVLPPESRTFCLRYTVKID